MTVDLSPARRDWALSVLKDSRDTFPGLSLEERHVYAVALLTADAEGCFELGAVAEAMDDLSVVAWAVTLLAMAGYAEVPA